MAPSSGFPVRRPGNRGLGPLVVEGGSNHGLHLQRLVSEFLPSRATSGGGLKPQGDVLQRFKFSFLRLRLLSCSSTWLLSEVFALLGSFGRWLAHKNLGDSACSGQVNSLLLLLRTTTSISALACVPCPTGLNTFESFNQVKTSKHPRPRPRKFVS